MKGEIIQLAANPEESLGLEAVVALDAVQRHAVARQLAALADSINPDVQPDGHSQMLIFATLDEQRPELGQAWPSDHTTRLKIIAHELRHLGIAPYMFPVTPGQVNDEDLDVANSGLK